MFGIYEWSFYKYFVQVTLVANVFSYFGPLCLKMYIQGWGIGLWLVLVDPVKQFFKIVMPIDTATKQYVSLFLQAILVLAIVMGLCVSEHRLRIVSLRYLSKENLTQRV